MSLACCWLAHRTAQLFSEREREIERQREGAKKNTTHNEFIGRDIDPHKQAHENRRQWIRRTQRH